MWVPTWGSSRVDVGADVVSWVWVGAIGVGQRPAGGLHPGSIPHKSPSCFAFLLPGEMAFAARFRGNEARSDHDVQSVPAIQCVTSMVREQRYPM